MKIGNGLSKNCEHILKATVQRRLQENNRNSTQDCIPVGWVPGVCMVLGVCAWSRWGAWSQGVHGPGGVVSQHALRQTPPPVNRMTDRCKNITLPQTSFAGGKNVLAYLRLFKGLQCTLKS